MNLEDGLTRAPHKGAMLLIARILRANEESIFCEAKDHSEPTYPLRVQGRLMGVSLVELGAQAAAAHVSLYAVGGAHTGLLLALHNVEVREHEVMSATRLHVSATKLATNDDGARFSFSVARELTELVRGEAMLTMRRIVP